jgi:hypothetical protein
MLDYFQLRPGAAEDVTAGVRRRRSNSECEVDEDHKRQDIEELEQSPYMVEYENCNDRSQCCGFTEKDNGLDSTLSISMRGDEQQTHNFASSNRYAFENRAMSQSAEKP